MAKKYYDGDITLSTDWGGDESTGNLPVIGEKVQKVIKEGINSKVGYVGRVEKMGQGFYVLTRDEETFNRYLETVTSNPPFGNLFMEGVNGRFDAPFNYKMSITLLNPENGYKSTLLGSTGNYISLKAETTDASNSPQNESVTVTFKVTTEGGVESNYTAIYDSGKTIEYNLDGKLGSGLNTIVITATGMNTGVSAMRRITYRLIDMYFIDRFTMNKRYQFGDNGVLMMDIGYSLKGVGRTSVVWYFDGRKEDETEIKNINPNISNANKTFYFTESDKWLTPGIHNIQMSMTCYDNDSGEEFHTPIYYREFIVEKSTTNLVSPYILRKSSFDYNKGFLENGIDPTIYGMKQFENAEIEYAVYYYGKSECPVLTYITYPNKEPMQVLSEKIPISGGFSSMQKRLVPLNEVGASYITLKSQDGENVLFETKYEIMIGESDMNITNVTDSVALSLSAFGRSNNSADRESWEYLYIDGFEEKRITTTFSKNEYVEISTKNIYDEVVPPSDANENNTLEVNVLPTVEDKKYKYLKFQDKYYVWSKEFDWSNTSGWHDNKLKLSKGNSITINYKPFSMDKMESLKKYGATYEFEFETTNVYNDNAVICRICGAENFAPGISIYASGAELVISREEVEPERDENGEIINTNAGYIKAVSTKYKSEESNRISFVITPNLESNVDGSEYRDRILKIYVNGELCGAYPYGKGDSFLNDSNITFRGSEDSCVNISSIEIFKRALSSNEILNNYIYYRNDSKEKAEVYKRNDIMSNETDFNSDKLKSQLPVMMIYQIDKNQSLDDIHQEKKNKKLTRFFDVVYINIQEPSKNFLVKNAYITPQGTSSMNYPVKNLRLYTGKKDDNGEYYSRLFVGSNIFIDGSPNNIDWENINLETEVKKKRQYSFKDGAIPVNCWCLKADFAESSSSHNTGTARFWNDVLKTNGLRTKAQVKAAQYSNEYPYDVRTCIDGFPISVFYQPLDGSSPRFEGKYNFNNDKSTESVFGFTGGIEIENQEVKYFYIGDEKPIIHSETNQDTGEVEYACSFKEGGYTETPKVNSPLYVSDKNGKWYMLRGKELLDNPKMECWELLNSVNEIALFKTMKGFGVSDDNEKVGIVNESGFDEAFESRYPDCGDYYHFNSLKRFGEWLVSCRYLNIDDKTGESVPFTITTLPSENYHINSEGKLSICSLTKQTHEIKFEFPGENFYKLISNPNIKEAGYKKADFKEDIDETTLNFKVVDELPKERYDEYEYVKLGDVFYEWRPSNYIVCETLPSVHESAYDYVVVDGIFYEWDNMIKMTDYHETQWVDDTPKNRALKFAVEKYDHIEMNKMAAYYIYLMRFGGVDQTVKNSMLTTEGPEKDDPNSTLPSLWYFINYDNDTILGVKNDGRLVFDPYITRQTKDGTGYVYAGRESTLWNNLEADTQFMEKVTEIDNVLAKGESNSLFALSYNNAIREYDINQSDKWCERIYNKDAERKYIQTYVDGWVQKVDKEGTSIHVYEDYLYDVQGSRSAHRKWWLGRRFNVFDSRFCNTNFRNALIKFRSTNLPAGSSFTIKSGEPIFYAWGHDNSVTEMTPTAIQPGNTYTFTTNSAFNIGSYLELMGSSNIQTLDLRNCVGALTELDITGCNVNPVGTKLKELLVGDNTRTDLVNVSNTSMKFSGLDKAVKLEVLDMTNIKNANSFDGLNTLPNIREVYAKGTSVSGFEFADGAMIEHIELPKTAVSLTLSRCSRITYDDIIFEDNKYEKLTTVELLDCPNLMTSPDFIFNWIQSKPKNQRQNLTLRLQGIDWTINKGEDLTKLLSLDEVGVSDIGKREIKGVITINSQINSDTAVLLQKIFGKGCFNEGSEVYIKVGTNIFIDMPKTLWEGEDNVQCNIIAVGITGTTSLDTKLHVYGKTLEELPNNEENNISIESTNGIITMDKSNLNNGYINLSLKESERNFKYLYVFVAYEGTTYSFVSKIKKRIYPNSIEILTYENSFNNAGYDNKMWLFYNPEDINDVNLDGRGFFNVNWEFTSGSGQYERVEIKDSDKEIAYIYSNEGADAIVRVKATVTRTYDNEILCENEKTLEFKDPNTIVTVISNEPLYNILVEHGVIIEDESGYGKLNKTDATTITMEDLVLKKYTEIDKPNDANNENTLTMSNLPDERQEKYKYVKVNNKYYKWGGTSIFQGNKNLVSFLEFEYFSGVGSMPLEGMDDIYTPDNMFKDCTALEDIALSFNFKYTANNMFEGCTSLKHIYGNSVKDGNGNPIKDENGKIDYQELGIEDVGANFAKNCKQLTICNLSSNVEHIGNDAFNGCMSLTTFDVPANSELVIDYTISSTPFTGCYNINFTGSSYDGTSDIKVRVKDNACYEIIDDNTVRLIHMGKDSLVSNIPTDKTVYASAYSMEYRKESDVVVPDNVIFDGDYIFYYSSGNSIKLNNIIGDSNCQSLFANTDYNGNYTFSENETVIPKNCFSGVTSLIEIIIPDNVHTIKEDAFVKCTELQKITLPKNLNIISSNVFENCNNLKYIKANYINVFELSNNMFNNNMLEEIRVLPEAYENFIGNIGNLYSPYIKLQKVYSEGYLRIIKDGDLFLDTDSLTIDGEPILTYNGDDAYMKYVTNSEINPYVFLDGEKIGEIKGLYTTIYVGDNSSLYNGYGFDFTNGINLNNNLYTEDEIMLLKDNIIASGWEYDERFKGLRSKNLNTTTKTSLSLSLKSNNNIPIIYGKYSYEGKENSFYCRFELKTDKDNFMDYQNGFYKNYITRSDNGEIIFSYDKNASTKRGIDGIVLNKIGEVNYSDPELPNVNYLNESSLRNVIVDISAPVVINNTIITVTDNKTQTYSKLWDGEPIVFTLPKKHDFIVYADDYITEEGKTYSLKESIFVGDNNNLTLIFETKTGVEIKENTVIYYDDYVDWYIYLDKFNGIWGSSNISEVNIDNPFVSENNGLDNTKIIANTNKNSIFANALSFEFFDPKVIGFIPTCLELEIFSTHLHEINEKLVKENKNIIDLSDLWTSESFNEFEAWNGNGEKISKDISLNYYIFGKKMR